MNRILAVSKPTRKHLINEKVHYIGITGKTSTSNHLSLNLMATLKILKHPNIFSTAHKEKSKTSH